ncbi:E3 SUMO-protein ligase ZBED1-like [Salvelinus alpinus]
MEKWSVMLATMQLTTKAMKMLKWTHRPCLAHTINLIVRDALKVMKPTVDKVKAAVEYFHRSSVGAEKLKSTQCQMGMPELRPKQDCTTMWNSTFYMLKRFLESKDAIISTLAIVNAPVDALTQEEWEVVEEVCRVLEPFEQVTVEISGESYVTASKSILLCKGLQQITASRHREANVTTGHVTELMDTLCSSMDRKFHIMEYNHVLSETAALDPRFKKLAFSDARAIDEALQRITAAGRDSPSSQLAQAPGQQEEEGSDGGEAPAVVPQTSAVWMLFDERATGDAARRNPLADAIMEVRSYLEEPLLQISADPLSWWKNKASVYPRLTKVMAGRLCIVGTSVPSERVFSKMGQIITERGNRISPSSEAASISECKSLIKAKYGQHCRVLLVITWQ